MEYFSFIQAVIAYVESRVKTGVHCYELEKLTGFSLSHVRAVFAKCTGISLVKYVRVRKIANAAFEMAHTDKSLLDIALDYGFESYDTFTRAFKRVIGIPPRAFRKQGLIVGRVKLSVGVYGPGFNGANPISQEESIMDISRTQGSCILHGVPKVEYQSGECTPFASCLKSCLSYLGQEISYSYLMAASGASFRLRWNTTCWDGGNVDLLNIFDNPMEAFQHSFIAAGRNYRILERTTTTNQAEFIEFIKVEIDHGRPVIALGIIGPPEACIVTGYEDDGHTLLGWNFFQDNPEFASDVKIHETGYFLCTTWWKNPCTFALMSVSEETESGIAPQEILANAITVMTNPQVREYAGGPRAFDAWASALADESQFPENAVLPLLFERLMCQGDAMGMISEGRYYAAKFLDEMGWTKTASGAEAAEIFRQETRVIARMTEILGGWQRGEEQAKNLAQASTRRALVELILEAKELDRKACTLLQSLLIELPR